MDSKTRTGHKAKYTIIGNSAAAVGAIEAIRDIDKKGSILIVSDEPYHVYSRPLISYYLAKKVTADNMHYRPLDFYKKNNVYTILGDGATSIDIRKKKIDLKSGETATFNKLLIATGGKPFIPRIKGLDGNGIFTFTKLNDAKALAKEIKANMHAVVIGGGLIGLKAAEGLHELGVDVTIIELADRLLSTILDNKGSAIFKQHLESIGIRVITGNTVDEVFRVNSKITSIRLTDADEIACDLLVVAIGVIPNTDVIMGTDIAADRGIIVDEGMRTNAADIYAAGDVVETYDILARVRRPQPIWPNAYSQGQVAGYNMAGQVRSYPGSFAMNSIEIGGLPVISVGMFDREGPGYEILVKQNGLGKTYKKIVIEHNCVVGAIFVGDIDRAGIITGLIKDKVPVGAFKKYLLSDEFGYAVFPESLRKERLLS